MKKLLLFFFAFALFLAASTAQESKIHLRYNENSQRLTVSEPGYMVLRYDMYLYPANSHEVIGPCHVDNSNEDIEAMSRFYDRVHPGDKVKMKAVRVMNMATKKAEWAPEYTIELR